MKRKTTIPLKRIDFMYKGQYAGSHILVKIKINSRTALMILDTGASSSVMNSETFHLFKNKAKLKDTLLKSSSANSVMESQYTTLNKIDLGGICFKGSLISTMNLSHMIGKYKELGVKDVPHGVFGMDMLVLLKCEIDIKNLKLRLCGLSKKEEMEFYDTLRIAKEGLEAMAKITLKPTA